MPTATQILTRALWLAFQASAPMGMGYLHANSAAKQTESTLLTECEPQTLSDGSLQVWTDYVCGRMMKTGFKVDKDGNLSITPETPRGDYQSWARKYATAAELVEATNQSF